MYSQGETDRRIQELEYEIRELRRMIGRVPIQTVPGGGGGFRINTATTKAGLAAVDAPALGYVTAGTEIDRYYVRKGDASTGTWEAFNWLES